MHLQRVQVPDFRVLKDVDITFEHDFNPRVFPLGSQNGGGKSTLLQLIFILLHCSTNSERLPALKNLLSGFNLYKGDNKRILAIIDIWDGEKTVQLEFFICGDAYLHQLLNLNDVNYDTDDNKNLNLFNFYSFFTLEDINQQISQFQQEEEELKGIIEQFSYRHSDTTPSGKFPDALKNRLLKVGIKFDSIGAEFSDPDSLGKIDKEAKRQLLNRHNAIKNQKVIFLDAIDKLIQLMQSSDIKYITYQLYKSEDPEPNLIPLLCHVKNLRIDNADQFLDELSNKIFLAAPSTQIFLFLSKNSRRSLFAAKNSYQSDLIQMNSILTGLFTYDFFATDILIDSFKRAGEHDFMEKLQTGKYGNNYDALSNDLEFLLHNKQVHLTPDFSSLTFTKEESNRIVELNSEDFSHGELKRLSIYIWLKYKNIEGAIVLMDEVDLALHPDWQYQIPTDLVEWEPSNQYILATHSYELCQALTPSHVKVLEPKLTERRSE